MPPSPTMSGQTASPEICSFGITQIACDSDEDRFCCSANNTNIKRINKIYSFGVFDGHGGNQASDKISKNLHSRVIERMFSTYANTDTDTLFKPIDQIFCSAFSTEMKKIDTEIKSESSAGSTSLSLFLIEQTNGSIRVLCPWVGDSRCIAFRSMDKDDRSVTTSTSLQSPITSAKSELSPNFLKSRTFSNFEIGDTNSGFYDFLSLTEDHKPNLPRERNRLENGIYTFYPEMAIDLDARTFHCINKSTSQSVNSLKDISIAADDATEKRMVEDLPLHLPERTKPSPQYTPRSQPPLSPKSVWESPDGFLTSFEEDSNWFKDSKMNLMFEKSYIGRRVGADGVNASGPTVICSRYGVSLNMSRSVGDRYGPRSCICVPDITAITVLPDQHARFILASDGMWDVLSDDQVEAEAMSIRDAQKLAQKLARRARAIRTELNIRMDDITVVVVDVHPEHMRIEDSCWAATVTDSTRCSGSGCTIS